MSSDSYQYKELSLLFDISVLMDQSLDLNDILNPILERVCEQLGMIKGALTILNRDTKEIIIDAAYGLSDYQISLGVYQIGEGITGKVVESGEPMIIEKISENACFLNKTQSRETMGVDISFICVPIKIGKSVIGSLSVDKIYQPEVALENDLKLLKVVASLIAQGVSLRQKAQEEIARLTQENEELHHELKNKFNPSNIVGSTKHMKDVYGLIEKVLNNKTTVLIRGESGVGKELVAHAIHYNGVRADKPFIKVNCAALPENLIESELFGFEKGAFTGANTMRKGRFEAADGGTIFLDEIGDFPLSTQIKLLRVIQEREIERLGSVTPIKIDVRIICATNQPLENLIESGKFRQDLYYRINVFPIYVPALRERKEDILNLSNHFVDKYSEMNKKEIKRISTSAIDMLMSYHWPGNVRELENCIERAVIMSTDGVIHSYHLPPTLQTAKGSGTDKIGTLEVVMRSVERDMIIDALKLSYGNVAKAARILGITERMMGLRVDKLDIDVKKYKKILR